MISTVPRRLAAIATLLLLASIPVRAADPPAASANSSAGDLWDVTSRMSMEGMPMEMPAQKLRVCAAKTWTKPPGGADERQKCVASDFTMTGNKASWTVSCAASGMTGKGEITRQSADAYTGTVKYTSAQGNMTVKLDGHRVGGCDNPM